MEPEALPPSEEVHEKPNWAKKYGWLGAVGIFLVAKGKWFLALFKGVLPALKFLKLGKVLTTSGSMLVSVWFYSLAFGWWFALGFVLLIFVHEMGHVFVAWRQGLPISAPIFIPGMGAIILSKEEGKSAWNEAVMGIGGPIGGTIGALLCWWIYGSTGNELFLGLAYVGFFLNLFNLTPVFPLDGGWITGAVSPYLWLIGTVMLVAGFVTGYIRNPLILILLLMSLPRLWQGIRHGKAHGDDVTPATKEQKILMGLWYVALAAFLAWAMGATHVEWTPERKQQYFGTQAS